MALSDVRRRALILVVMIVGVILWRKGIVKGWTAVLVPVLGFGGLGHEMGRGWICHVELGRCRCAGSAKGYDSLKLLINTRTQESSSDAVGRRRSGPRGRRCDGGLQGRQLSLKRGDRVIGRPRRRSGIVFIELTGVGLGDELSRDEDKGSRELIEVEEKGDDCLCKVRVVSVQRRRDCVYEFV
jgi:hypothetical protein